MKLRSASLIVIASIYLLLSYHQVLGQNSQWEPLTPGIDYRDFYLSDPNHIYVARMDRLNQDVILETSIAEGKLSGKLEPVSGMAKRYDQAINFWGEELGGRNQVVVAINGYFYDTETGIPWRGQVHSGWYSKRFDDLENGSGFAWKLDRSFFLGGCVLHHPKKQFVKNLRTGEEIYFDTINTAPEGNELILFTPQYDANTLYAAEIEVTIKLDQPALLLGSPAFTGGTVSEVRDGFGQAFIPFDHVVLSAAEGAGDRLRNKFMPGDAVAISQEIKHFESDCKTDHTDNWSKTYAATGGSYIFLRNGEIQKLGDLGAILRNARTAIAYDDRYIYFVVVNDKEPLGNLGMSIVELADFVKNTLGAAWGMALDGGGSSTMVVNGEVMNKTPVADPEVSEEHIERAVANGVMMVYVHPKEQSSKYSIGDRFITSENSQLSVRLGPGTNYYAIGSVPENTEGVILEHASDLNGVYAKGYYWWYVSLGTYQGWVAEDYMVPHFTP
jgi:hypothetical protein